METQREVRERGRDRERERDREIERERERERKVEAERERERKGERPENSLFTTLISHSHKELWVRFIPSAFVLGLFRVEKKAGAM